MSWCWWVSFWTSRCHYFFTLERIKRRMMCEGWVTVVHSFLLNNHAINQLIQMTCSSCIVEAGRDVVNEPFHKLNVDWEMTNVGSNFSSRNNMSCPYVNFLSLVWRAQDVFYSKYVGFPFALSREVWKEVDVEGEMGFEWWTLSIDFFSSPTLQYLFRSYTLLWLVSIQWTFREMWQERLFFAEEEEEKERKMKERKDVEKGEEPEFSGEPRRKAALRLVDDQSEREGKGIGSKWGKECEHAELRDGNEMQWKQDERKKRRWAGIMRWGKEMQQKSEELEWCLLFKYFWSVVMEICGEEWKQGKEHINCVLGSSKKKVGRIERST